VEKGLEVQRGQRWGSVPERVSTTAKGWAQTKAGVKVEETASSLVMVKEPRWGERKVVRSAAVSVLSRDI